MKIGPAYDKNTDMGPVVNAGHLKFVTNWIETGIKEGADLILDGRNVRYPVMKAAFMSDQQYSTM